MELYSMCGICPDRKRIKFPFAAEMQARVANLKTRMPPWGRRNLIKQLLLFWCAIPPAGRRNDGEGFASLENCLVTIAKHFH